MRKLGFVVCDQALFKSTHLQRPTRILKILDVFSTSVAIVAILLSRPNDSNSMFHEGNIWIEKSSQTVTRKQEAC